jgi:hypothetical protein
MAAVNTDKAQRHVRLQVMRDGKFHPADLLLDETLTNEEKKWILEQRIEDMTSELRASDESMTREAPGGSSAERLRDAQRTLQLLQTVPPAGPNPPAGVARA